MMLPEIYFLPIAVGLHIWADFGLQDFEKLNQFKQSRWWKDHAPDRMYRFDWIMAMFLHGFQWALIVIIPWAVRYAFEPVRVIKWVVLQALLHALIDTAKSEWRVINLIEDQLLHLTQLEFMAMAFAVG